MKIQPVRACTFAQCENTALTLSEPALCGEHVGDIDDWYLSARQTVAGFAGGDNVRYLYASLAHQEYMVAISDDAITEELYGDFVGRAEQPKGLAFSIDHFVTVLADFFITAAVSGILGNLTYDTLKACVARVLSLLHKKPKPDDERFEEIIEHEKYEEIRKRFHLKTPLLEIDRETEKKIIKRYRNIVEDGFEKNEDLLFRPKRKEGDRERTD